MALSSSKPSQPLFKSKKWEVVFLRVESEDEECLFFDYTDDGNKKAQEKFKEMEGNKEYVYVRLNLAEFEYGRNSSREGVTPKWGWENPELNGWRVEVDAVARDNGADTLTILTSKMFTNEDDALEWLYNLHSGGDVQRLEREITATVVHYVNGEPEDWKTENYN